MKKDDLLKIARKAKSNSYSPYSNFKVGAAVLGENGKIYTGTNVENASYGLTICAERSAIFAAVSDGNKKINAIAISCDKKPNYKINEVMPCGACRQVMAEFMRSKGEVIVDGAGKFSMSALLPKSFNL